MALLVRRFNSVVVLWLVCLELMYIVRFAKYPHVLPGLESVFGAHDTIIIRKRKFFFFCSFENFVKGRSRHGGAEGEIDVEVTQGSGPSR